jgi:hypothetical protein
MSTLAIKGPLMSDAIASEPQPFASPYVTPRKRAARKPTPKQFVYRVTVCLDNSELECLNKAKLAFRSTESFLVRMALDNFLKQQGLMSPTGFPITGNGANPNGK